MALAATSASSDTAGHGASGAVKYRLRDLTPAGGGGEAGGRQSPGQWASMVVLEQCPVSEVPQYRGERGNGDTISIFAHNSV